MVFAYDVLRMKGWVVVRVSLYRHKTKHAGVVLHLLIVIHLRINFNLVLQEHAKLILVNAIRLSDVLAQVPE